MPDLHDPNISLVTGSDRLLLWLRRGFALLSMSAILLCQLTAGWQVAWILAVAIMLAQLERRERRRVQRRLRMTRAGACELDGVPVDLLNRAWLSGRYAIICVAAVGQIKPLLISASQQSDGEYRKLLAWIRLKPWNSV